MGLSNFPSPAEGVLPLLVVNAVISAALLKNAVRSMLRLVGVVWSISPNGDEDAFPMREGAGERRRVSITQFKILCDSRSGVVAGAGSECGSRDRWGALTECCVCLCGFEGEEEVSELSCKHFFHKGCLEKWFDKQHTSCPLCRSVL
ncbi:probable E3 ubiquitin-protein ligase XERICO [Malania oleifera]|uniref:probable E3 ubiquitin-protein ligase XERICO n=1 Tax=Malania oleifera TaxID=397392 RepID=UPI0025AE243B|nr:probable E3 ubiquitin-protein ligase XERICO [Malania oleifera]